MKTTLHIVAGPPCSGKTTYAKQLSEELNCPLVSADQILGDFKKIDDQPLDDFEKFWFEAILLHCRGFTDVVIDGAALSPQETSSYVLVNTDAILELITSVQKGFDIKRFGINKKDIEWEIHWMSTSLIDCCIMNHFNNESAQRDLLYMKKNYTARPADYLENGNVKITMVPPPVLFEPLKNCPDGYLTQEQIDELKNKK